MTEIDRACPMYIELTNEPPESRSLKVFSF